MATDVEVRGREHQEDLRLDRTKLQAPDCQFVVPPH